MKKKLKLDLGCGQNCNVSDIMLSRENLQCDHRWEFIGYDAKCKLCDSTGHKFTGVDFVKCDGVDIVHDLTVFPYPFEDESVDEIFSSHFIEHLDGHQRIKFMEEIYRILAPHGKAKFIHPYYKSVRAIQDPTHMFPPIAENSYFYWNRKWMVDNKLEHYGIKCDFEIKSIYYVWQDMTWGSKAEEARTFAVDKYWNVVADMVVELEKNPSTDFFVKDDADRLNEKQPEIKHSIIIPTYNRCTELLKPCIESILKYTDLFETEIIVSANGCTDETREYISGLKNPNIRLVWSDERLGYPKAVNAGIRFAKGEYIIPLNNDTVLLPQQKNEWINILKKPFLNDQVVGLTAPMKVHSPQANRAFLIFFCVMIHKKVIDKIGLLDESFGDGYGEDTAFCCEAEDAGFKIIQVPQDSDIYYEEKRMTGQFPIYHIGNVTFKDWKDGDKLLENNNRILERYDRTKPTYRKKDYGFPKKTLDELAALTGQGITAVAAHEQGIDSYVEVLKYSLIGLLTDEENERFMSQKMTEAEMSVVISLAKKRIRFEQIGGSQRTEHIPDSGMTMIGLSRLNDLQKIITDVVRLGIDGDFAETGVWRGGACIFMALLLKRLDPNTKRIVYVCDSFNGLPEPDVRKYPADFGSQFHLSDPLKVSLERVKNNFKKYGVDESMVRYVPGYFSESMQTFPSNKIAILRLDGDMYSSTYEVLKHVYDKVVDGGYVIVDDYGIESCKKAIDDFRKENNIVDEIKNTDETGIYWNKSSHYSKFLMPDVSSVDISRAQNCDGYMSDLELVWLAERSKDKKVAVEIGSWHGRSSRSIADHLPEGGVLYCVDTWNGSVLEQETNHASAKMMEGDHAFYEFLQNNLDLVNKGKIIPMRMSGSNAAKIFTEKGMQFDFCFIDAGHSYEEVKTDIMNWLPLVKKGGILSGHDYYMTGEWSGVKMAVDELIPNVSVAIGTSIWHTEINAFLYEKHKHILSPKIYDCFPFFNELDILEARFEELWSVVDRFVIAEATLTHGGQKKPLYFHENLKRFEKYLSKITHIVVDQYPQLDSWSIERHQRDALMRGLTGCKENDIIIMGDADEIPKAEVVKNYKTDWGLCCIRQSLYYYNFNCKANGNWDWLRILPYSIMKNMTPCQVRYTVNYDRESQIIKDGGWHFSYFSSIDGIIEKIKASAHQEYNKDEFTNRQSVEQAVRSCRDLFGRNLQYDFIQYQNQQQISSQLPKYVSDNYSGLYSKYFTDLVINTNEFTRIASN